MSKFAGMTTLLIANRGEIARRILRAAHEMGLRTVAVYSEPDAHAPFVREADVAVPLHGATATETYLNQRQIIAAAQATAADAIHPGYGFLAENADFAAACLEAGLLWVGPPPEAIRQMGLKVVAKALARTAGVPTLPDAAITSDRRADWEMAARTVGYPLLVKASAGGGGKGMRRVDDAAALAESITGARREAKSSFGDATVFLERYLPAPRHVEIQVFADTHGHTLHLYERECSVQRRYQKVIEEAPSPGVTPALRERMAEASVALTRAIGYVGAGTIEYLVDGDDFYFLEMNTRLQVEHPVTECVTGLDLVRLQLQSARGEPLPFAQRDVACAGHAIEVRLYGEDPAAGFLPSVGRVACFEPGLTPGVRYDSGVESGSEVSPYYDPLLAKIIAHASSREEAARRLARALDELRLHGLRTNRDFLAATLRHADFLAGETRTDFIPTHPGLLTAQPPAATQDAHALAAVAALAHQRHSGGPLAFAPSGWRNVRSAGQRIALQRADGETLAVDYVVEGERGSRLSATLDGRALVAEALEVEADGVRFLFAGALRVCRVTIVGDRVYVNSADGQSDLRELPRFVEPAASALAQGPVATLPGVVVSVAVGEGERVTAGQTLLTLEAMKMEHRITANADARVERVLVKVGDKVDAHQPLVTLATDEE
ncbi:MAG TPA: biotin carboxylase N-terminal domain-containing protein [Ktedonobacterales bacterium]